MPLVIVAIGVALLLLLMIRFKMNGFIALVLVALAVGLMQGMPLDKVIVSIKNGVGGTLGSLALIMGFGAMLGKLLADCGGGAFKQVLVDSGMDKYIASIMHESNMSPLFMAWSIAAVLRIALGSATVAAITAGGIAAPLIATTGVSPELMVIAVGSGSVIFSHVNDPGFWLFKEYFNLTIGETIKSWSVLETIISVCGLVGCLLLGMVV